MTEAELPFVTFAVLNYNGADWIREAVQSAFAQDYPHLEILFSDDCSTDGSYEMLQEIVASYKGPRRVRLVQTSRNSYISGNLNRIAEAAAGDLIVKADGDDISLPHRTSALVAAWLRGGRKAGLLHSATIRFSGPDNEDFYPNDCLSDLSSVERVAATKARAIGATEAFVPEIFSHFGPLRERMVHEDGVLPFRSLLLDRPVTYVEEPLVRYRQGSGVSTMYGARHPLPAARRLMLSRYLEDTLQRIDDLEKVDKPHLRPILERVADRYRAALEFEDGWPRPVALVKWARSAGLWHVLRMTAKRARNLVLDRQALLTS
ncbi:glycosyltransferase family 2 protein [Sphingomonas mesophila]|uniref:glycosyltransferase family 2 protein n=1 Tax=Sphingomonas mesophila TaxID=2303576 RepID=UPI000E56B02D|nr:glycosyltransferase family 2 protein [Sphingomonas mesophila]